MDCADARGEECAIAPCFSAKNEQSFSIKPEGDISIGLIRVTFLMEVEKYVAPS
jgi:hypothetical protein